MHVWSHDSRRFPFDHPYNASFKPPNVDGTVETLIQDMDQNGVTHCILVQVIFHGWDNRYVADCVRRHPKRLRAHGLIDPTDPQASDKLEYWVTENGLSGMRFSPIYYRGKEDWLDSTAAHRLWKTAEKLEAVLNFFIAPEQLPRLENMVRGFPEVRVVIDHLGQMDLGAEDAREQLRRLLALARYDNVWVKLSELTSVSQSGKYPFQDAYPVVERVAEAFGVNRLLWGTGYPGGAARAYYKRPTLAQELALVREELPFLTSEEKAMILGLNAARLWKLNG
jgi:predicted TIM-barrel fold metal-dependent hydrolase